MKKKITYLSVPIALIGLVFALYLLPVSPSAFADDETNRAFLARQLEGTWRVTIVSEGGDPFQALYTFARGGVMHETDESSLPLSFGPSQGVWERTGPNRYAYTWESFASDPNFPDDVKLRVHGVITLTGRDTYNAQVQFEFFDAEGNVTFSGCATDQATRMTIDPVTSCPADATQRQSSSVNKSGVANSKANEPKGWRR
jgi:hypothetical protein